MKQSSNDPNALKVAAGLVLAGVLLFGASFNDPFHFDDALILNDSNVTNSVRWTHFLNPLHLRQLTFFSFYLNHLVGGDSPFGYHVVNVGLHIANALLLFLLVRRFAERWIAIVAAAVFLVHPIQTEAVLYVYQRSVLLAVLFSLAGLIALAEQRYWLAAVFFFCAFESKESALAIPLTVAAVSDRRRFMSERSSAVRDRRHSRALVIGPIVLGIATLGILTYWGERTVGIGASQQISPLRYFLTETRVVFTYFRLLLWPYPQSLEYEFPASSPILPLIGLVAIVAAAWWLSRLERWRVPGLCILVFFILLAPTSSIIPSADAAFEHRLYLPMLAFSILAAYVLSKVPERSVIAVALLIPLCVLTVRRETVWSSDIALWEDTAKRAPGKARVWFNLGGAYLRSEPDKARTALLNALEIQPEFPEALYDLGVIEQGKGNWSMALVYYDRALTKQPDYWPALNNKGNTLFAMGQRERALEYFENTLRLNPGYWPAQYNIAIVHFMSGRYEKAVPKLRTVLDWRPDFREARYLLALSLTQAGDRGAANEEWTKLGGFAAAESRITPTMILAPNRP